MNTLTAAALAPLLVVLLGRVALVALAQRPIAIKLSRGRSVGLCVGLSSALWKNGGSDPDAVWLHRSDGSRDEADGCLLYTSDAADE